MAGQIVTLLMVQGESVATRFPTATGFISMLSFSTFFAKLTRLSAPSVETPGSGQVTGFPQAALHRQAYQW